ncbi:MAG TPA: hypothetical protein VFB66_31935 [Tepidisphaeraceae bacterium]|nr:hypothetical protein [Tepidisphaeraceae bacterium]
MDEFVGFSFVLLDASGGKRQKVRVVERGPRRERVDVVARQFRDVLREGDPADASPRWLILTHDFKLRRQLTGPSAGWLAFLVDRGDGTTEKLEEVALVAFARQNDAAARAALKKLDPYVNLADLPPPPLVVAVRLAERVPSIISEWYGKSVAAFFTGTP